MPPPTSRRLAGAQEHLERAQFLFDVAAGATDHKAAYRLLLAAIYSCRAITEIMLEAAGKQEVPDAASATTTLIRAQLEPLISRDLEFYALIERIRIHDFHRLGLLPPDPTKKQMTFGGPIKLKVQCGVAAVALTSEGSEYRLTGSSEVKEQRPLLTRDDEIYDDESAKFVSLKEIVRRFLATAPTAISAFASNVA